MCLNELMGGRSAVNSFEGQHEGFILESEQEASVNSLKLELYVDAGACENKVSTVLNILKFTGALRRETEEQSITVI